MEHSSSPHWVVAALISEKRTQSLARLVNVCIAWRRPDGLFFFSRRDEGRSQPALTAKASSIRSGAVKLDLERARAGDALPAIQIKVKPCTRTLALFYLLYRVRRSPRRESKPLLPRPRWRDLSRDFEQHRDRSQIVGSLRGCRFPAPAISPDRRKDVGFLFPNTVSYSGCW